MNLIILTETWIKDNTNDEFYLQQCCPNGYYYLSANRKEKSCGGLALFYDGNLRVDNFSNKRFTNAEVAFLELTLGKSVYLLLCIYLRPNTNVRVFISELTSSFIEEKALLFKNLLIVGDINISMLLSNDASRNWISFLDEFGLQQQVTVPTLKNGGFLDQVITSEEVEVSEPLVSSVKSSDHGVVHFDLLQKHENLDVKKTSCRKWLKFDVVAFAQSIVAPIGRDNHENVWNSVLMNEISYVDKKHPLKTEYMRNHTCFFFDDELITMKKSKRKFEKAYRKNGNSQAKSRFLNSVLEYFELFTKRKVNTSKNVSLVKISVLGILCCSNS